MSTFIGIESLAANALIELLEKKNKREVPFSTLVAYGMEIKKIFKQETGEDVILLLSREYQMGMINDYSQFFEVTVGKMGEDIFSLREEANIDELKQYFRWTMEQNLFKAFTNDRAIKILGVAA